MPFSPTPTRRALAVVAAIAVASTPALAQKQQGKPAARAAAGRKADQPASIYRVTHADSVMVGTVLQRLIAVTPNPDVEFHWPPTWRIQLSDRDSSEINAFATPQGEVLITPPMLNLLVKGNADYLAAVLGHELGHHILHHTTRANWEQNSNAMTAQSGFRANEASADSLGAVLAVRAGYSWTKILQGMIGEQDAPGQDYSSAEAVLFSDHPAMANRAAFLNAIRGNQKQVTLWREMDAFHMANTFLLDEQYELAAKSYGAVAKEFPDAGEAWANVGFAKLMQYCDKLDASDIEKLGIMPPMVPAFYRRPASLEAKVRGFDASLWYEAVGALQHANKVDPSLSLVKANLALAYLVHPSGKPDLTTATKWIRAATAAAASDSILTPENRIAMYVNAGVIDMVSGRMSQAGDDYAAARHEIESLPDYQADAYVPAFVLNEGLYRAASSDRDTAVAGLKAMEKWLLWTGQSSPWWKPVFDGYTSTAQKLGLTPGTVEQFQQRATPHIRRVLSVSLGGGQSVTIGEPIADVKARLGAGTTVRVSGTDVAWTAWPEKGIRVLASSEVLDILVSGDNAPALEVKQAASTGAPAQQLTIGMDAADLPAILGADYEFKRLDPDAPAYRFYGTSGIGIRVKSGKVVELVIGPGPRGD